MSGTPMPNSPIELYPVLSSAAPETINFMSRFDYARRYCAAYKKAFGWDMSGSSNEQELGRRVIAPHGRFMLRIKKSALNLPPKIEELFIISGGMTPRLAELDSRIGAAYKSEDDLIKLRISAKAGDEDLHMMSYRRLLGVEKVPRILPYIKSLLEEGKESILIFAHHNEVVSLLAEALKKFKPFVITGGTPVGKRQALVKEFQSSGLKRPLFIGNYKAMGVGYTLTKATRAIFVEYDWTPGVNDQASDRIHRIGQKSSVLVQYVVYKDSLDKRVLEGVLRKRASVNKILEG